MVPVAFTSTVISTASSMTAVCMVTLTDTVSWPLDFVITFDFDRMLDTDLCRLVIMSVEVLHFRIRKKFCVRLLDKTTALWRIILHAIVNRFQLA